MIILHLSGLAGAQPCVSLKETAAGQCFNRHSRSRSRGEGSGVLLPIDVPHLLPIMQGHVQGDGITSSQFTIWCPHLSLYTWPYKHLKSLWFLQSFLSIKIFFLKASSSQRSQVLNSERCHTIFSCRERLGGWELEGWRIKWEGKRTMILGPGFCCWNQKAVGKLMSTWWLYTYLKLIFK